MVAGIQEELDVPAQVVMAGILVAVHGRFLERAPRPFDLPIAPGMMGLVSLCSMPCFSQA